MATEFLREKINALGNWVLNEEIQRFQHQLLVDAAATSTGDQQIDKTIRDQANNARAVVMASEHRLKLYRVNLSTLNSELEEVQKADKAASDAAAT